MLVTLDQLKRREEELVQLNQELGETNRGVVALYAEIDEKAASLQRANEIKTSFLANMTHEFRTPLTSIMSLARLLLDRLDGELTSEQEKQVRYIRSSADGLMDLVNNLLDIAKVEAGKISIKPTEFTVTELIGALRGVFRPLLPAGSPVDLVYDVPDEMRPLITDEAKLSQILRNLVSNALKFTERGIVRVKVRPDDHDTLLFEVRDTGIGLAEEHFELIFEDFSQIESQVQKKLKGTGLGLPLSRKLATLIGGQLWVESVLGHGASFFLRIPWHFRGSEEGVLIGGCESSENNHSSAKVFHEPRILLIDDEETCRYVLKALISRNYQAHFFEANGGHEGLHVAAEAKPDVIFLDLVMPDMTGLETLRNLRSDASLESIPVFINTTKKMSEDERDQLMQLSQGIFLKDAWDSDEQREQLREKFAALRIAPMSGATDRQISGRTHV